MLLYLRFVLEKTTALWLFTSLDFSRGYIFQSCSFLVCVHYQLAFLHASNLRKPSGNIIEWSIDDRSSEFIWLISLPSSSVRSKKEEKKRRKSMPNIQGTSEQRTWSSWSVMTKGLGSTSLSQITLPMGNFPWGRPVLCFFTRSDWVSAILACFKFVLVCGQTGQQSHFYCFAACYIMHIMYILST